MSEAFSIRPEAFPLKPRIKTTDEDYNFSEAIEAARKEKSKLLALPPKLKSFFDEGYRAVRINSHQSALDLFSYGDEGKSYYSLLPHQDNTSSRFLALSSSGKDREASTYLVFPETIALMIPEMISYFETNKSDFEMAYASDSAFTESQFKVFCAKGGIPWFVKKLTENMSPEKAQLESAYFLSVLFDEYAGTHADILVEQLLVKYEGAVVISDWKKSGVLLVDNRAVLHGRKGKNTPPLKRAYFV